MKAKITNLSNKTLDYNNWSYTDYIYTKYLENFEVDVIENKDQYCIVQGDDTTINQLFKFYCENRLNLNLKIELLID